MFRTYIFTRHDKDNRVLDYKSNPTEKKCKFTSWPSDGQQYALGFEQKSKNYSKLHTKVHNPRLKPIGIKDVPRKTPIGGKTPVKFNISRNFL